MVKAVVQFKNVNKTFPIIRSEHIVNNFLSNLKSGQNLKIHALKDITFSIKKGECVGIVGPNGSGKTTLINLIADVIKPDKGVICINGKISALRIGLVNKLTIGQNIKLWCAILDVKNKNTTEKIINFAGLQNYENLPVAMASAGMRRRLGFSIGIQAEGDIVLLDECLDHTDKAFFEKAYILIEQLKNKNKTVVLVFHNLASIEKFCKRTIFLYQGKIMADRDTKTVLKRYKNFKFRKNYNA